MKTILTVTLSFSTILACWGQSAGQRTSAIPADTAYSIVERGANHNVWEKLSYEMGPDGKVVPRTHRYVELASGMNYKDANGQWRKSKEVIESYPGGAIAQSGQYQVIFANNLNSYGAIDVQTPDKKRLRSNILGLMYHDTATDKAVLIAQVQDSEGELISANQVLYPDAFQGIKADVRYTYRKGSFEQDVILREQPPTPESFGLDPNTTELEVMTEFINPPVAVLKNSNRGADDDVNWGAMRINGGKAFDLGGEGDPRSHAPVDKTYINIQGNHMLLEKVKIRQIQSNLSKLPLQSSIRISSQVKLAKNITFPNLPQERDSKKVIKFAVSTPSNQGYVLDYVQLNTDQTDFTFKSDTTYLITDGVNLSGLTTFEGGTVIKYDRSPNPDAILQIWGGVKCDTKPYSPAVFTSKQDNSIGENVSDGYTNWNYLEALYIDNDAAPLTNLRISYAQYAIHDHLLTLKDSQIVNCVYGIQDEWWGGGGYTCNLTNVLFGNVQYPLLGTHSTWKGCNLTVAGCQQLCDDWNSSGDTMAFVNSLLVGVTNYGDATVTTDHTSFASDNSIFQTVGGGHYYLAASSPYRDIGTANIDTATIASLAQKTTYPPIAYTNATFNTATTFSPQAERDTNTPDLGYHYDPLDYTFGGCTANSNLTFTAGTAVGWFRTTSGWYHAGHGIHVGDQQSVSFQGTATDPCYWVRLNTVQEQDKTAGYGPGGISSWVNSTDVSHWPTMRLNFTKCSLMAGEGGGFFRDDWGFLIVRAAACEFSAGNAGGYGTSMDFTNCLLDRTYFANVSGAVGNEVVARNCTVHGGFIQMNTSTAFPISIRDCALDGTRLDLTGYAANNSYADYSYNAFTNSTNPFPFGGNNVVVTNFNWQSGLLGNFYLPSDSPLINHGSTTADQVGLYHFTTQTNQMIEAKTKVDIGYHYVAEGSGKIDTVWVEDAVPAGASSQSDNGDAWTWVSSSPNSYSGLLASQSNIGSAEHQHYFNSASDTLTVNTGDTLIAYIYLDPTNTPSEVVLQWNNGSWEHRAYWGANNINWGVNGTASRYYMGSLPAVGQWVRLEVPANAVGLEGQTLNGMAFSLYGGRATWDYAGKGGATVCYDTDGDGIPDYLEDKNGNGIFDSGDIASWILTDTDGNGISDGNEDADGDGLSNWIEINVTHTDPLAYDSVQPSLPKAQAVSDSEHVLIGRQGSGGVAPQDHLEGELWYEITQYAGSQLTLLVHNTQPGAKYLIFSIENSVNGKWRLEKSFSGDPVQSNTQVIVKTWNRSILFLLVATAADLDGDNIYDAWVTEVAHGTVGAFDPTANPDGDEVNNYEEYLQGRDPLSAGTLPDSSGTFINLQLYTQP